MWVRNPQFLCQFWHKSCRVVCSQSLTWPLSHQLEERYLTNTMVKVRSLWVYKGWGYGQASSAPTTTVTVSISEKMLKPRGVICLKSHREPGLRLSLGLRAHFPACSGGVIVIPKLLYWDSQNISSMRTGCHLKFTAALQVMSNQSQASEERGL